MLPQIFLLLLTIVTQTNGERIITTQKYSIFRVVPTVINGNPVVKGQIPYLVSFKEPALNITGSKRLWTNLCGGSIIKNSQVLTAAHCFEDRNYFYAKNFDRLRVVAGNLHKDLVHSGNTSTLAGAQWRSIAKVVLHQHFHFPTNDIALVFVDQPFVYSATVDFIIPARKMLDYPKTCMAAGFGQINKGHELPRELMWADIAVLSKKQCDIWWEMDMNEFICTNSQASDVGAGDSGGPLACYGTVDPNEQQGRDLLVGIVSGKNYDKTTLFTRVSSYDNWIRSEGRTCSSCVCEPAKFVLILSIILTYIRLLILFILCT